MSRLAIMESFERFRPAMPTITTPASGRVIGSHGRRLSARRCCCFFTLPAVFGPDVVMVRVTCCGDVAPWAIVLKPQVIVASGRLLHLKVTASAKVVAPPVAVTVKVEEVAIPAGAGAGVEGVVTVKVGAFTT